MSRSSHPEVVYFIQAVDGGPIKIGITTNLKKRLSALQGGNPTKLRVLGTFEGGYLQEQFIHRMLAKHCVLNEWFEDCEEVRAWASGARFQKVVGDLK